MMYIKYYGKRGIGPKANIYPMVKFFSTAAGKWNCVDNETKEMNPDQVESHDTKNKKTNR